MSRIAKPKPGGLNYGIKVSELDRPVLFENYTVSSTDELGGKTKTWATLFADKWCKLDYVSVNEEDNVGKHSMTTKAFLTTRYRIELKDNKIRATLDSKVYDVLGYEEFDRRAFLRLKIQLVDV